MLSLERARREKRKCNAGSEWRLPSSLLLLPPALLDRFGGVGLLAESTSSPLLLPPLGLSSSLGLRVLAAADARHPASLVSRDMERLR